MTLLRDLILSDDARPNAKIPDYCRQYSSGNACKDRQCPLVHVSKCKNALSSNPQQAWEARCKLLAAGFDTNSRNAVELYLSLEKRKNDVTVVPKRRRGSSDSDTGNHSRKIPNSNCGITGLNSANFARATMSTVEFRNSRFADVEFLPYICVDHLRDMCPFSATECSNIHTNNLFVWQYKSNDSACWNNFPDFENNALEAMYCMPEIEPVPGIIDGPKLKVLFWFKDMRTKIFKDGSGGTHARLRRVEVPGLMWNYFYRFSRLGSPWRLMRKFNDSGINSEDVHEMFESLPPGEIKVHPFEIKNHDKKSTQNLFMLKSELPSQYLIFQMSEKKTNVSFIKRRPHWHKPSLEDYLESIYSRYVLLVARNPSKGTVFSFFIRSERISSCFCTVNGLYGACENIESTKYQTYQNIEILLLLANHN